MNSEIALNSESEDNPRYKWEVLAIIMIGTFMGTLDASIVNVSLPNIMASFGSPLDDVEWVVIAYMLGFAVAIPLTGWFKDRVGHKHLYVMSLTLFTFGSILCAMAWNLPSLIIARIIQAFGGGAITPTAMAMISDVFEPRERGRALGYWGIALITGPAVGPTLGGFLTNEVGWRSIFAVNLPVGVLGVLAAMFVLKPDRPHPSARKPFDLGGFCFLTMFLVAFLLGLSKGEREGWESPYIVICLIFSIIGLGGFLLVESLVRDGIMDIRLFKYPIFSVCMVVTVIRSIALFGSIFLVPIFLQRVMGFDEIDCGLLMLPGAIVIGCIMPIAGWISDRSGPRLLAIAGQILTAYFMYLYRGLDVNTSVWGVIYPMLIRGLGIGLLFVPITAAALNSIPRHKSGVASSMLNLIQQVAASIGVALLAMVLSHRQHFHQGNLGQAMREGSPAIARAMRGVVDRALSLGYGAYDSQLVAKAAIIKNTIKSASVAAFDDAFFVGALIVVVGILPSLLLPKRSIGDSGVKVVAE